MVDAVLNDDRQEKDQDGKAADDALSYYHEQVLNGLLEPVAHHMQDGDVSEVMINGCKEIYVERNGELEKTSDAFHDETALESLARGILQFVDKQLSKDDLSVEARLPDGSRVHIVQHPAAVSGMCIAIRKFPKEPLKLDKLVKSGSVTEEATAFLRRAMALRRNIIVSGGTGSGKTTMLNVLGELIGETERVIVIEDATELQLPKGRHVVQFEAKPPNKQGLGGASIRDLFRASLRMRPDRILVGECRGGEAIDMIQAMNSGHSGSLSTVHANGPRDALSRLETLCLMSDLRMPLIALQFQLAAAVNVILQVGRSEGRRRVLSISEVIRFDTTDADYVMRDIFKLAPSPNDDGGLLAWTGETPWLGGEAHTGAAELTRSWKRNG